MTTKDQLLAQVEDVLRSQPPKQALYDNEEHAVAWAARCAAILNRWDRTRTTAIDAALRQLRTDHGAEDGRKVLIQLLYQARADLAMEVGALNVVIPKGGVFDYFDEIRKLLELAKTEVFFVDPYLDADFVSRYLPHVQSGVIVRLLTSDKPSRLNVLMPAVQLFTKQSGVAVEVRSSADLHDRYIFVDQKTCHHSGASFKDGAKNSPTALNQISDAFSAVWDTYDALWRGGKVER